ncbi:MAG: hypothetical protein ACOZQL_04750 [Myxococcota bacterium]
MRTPPLRRVWLLALLGAGCAEGTGDAPLTVLGRTSLVEAATLAPPPPGAQQRSLTADADGLVTGRWCLAAPVDASAQAVVETLGEWRWSVALEALSPERVDLFGERDDLVLSGSVVAGADDCATSWLMTLRREVRR